MADTTHINSQLVVSQLIPTDQIHPSRHQARKDFDEEGIQQLAASIQREDLLQPITVRKVGDGYELIAGERRLRAVKSLGRPTIEARVITVVSEAAACAKGLVENLQRKDLNPMEEAEGFQQLGHLDTSHWTHEEIATVAGRSRSYVTQSLGFLQLPAAIQTDVRRLTLNRSQILEIMRLSDPKAQLEVADMAKDLSIKEIRMLVGAMVEGKRRNKSPKSAPPVPADPLANLWPSLSPSLAANTYWEAKYGVHKPAPGTIMNGWFFFAMPHEADSPKARLAEWFSAMARALGMEDHETSRPGDHEKETGDSNLFQSRSPEVSKSELRLPQTDQELAELESIAAASPGPQPVYAWIYGPHNEITQMMAGRTWAEMGVQGPKEGLRKLLEGVKMMKGMGR